MTKDQRAIYFSQLWPDACTAKSWDPRAQEWRRTVTLECMRMVGAPPSDSTTSLGEAETTALFVYLLHLANPDDLPKLSDWMSVQEDYRAFHLARQGDYWRKRAGYAKRGKLDRDRFANKPTAGIFDESKMTREEAEQYVLTMRNRARRKAARANQPAPAKEEDPF